MFAANAKSMLSRAEVAALLGHGSIDTAGTHYAERWSASGHAGVRPSQDDVESVIDNNRSLTIADPLGGPG